MRVVGACTRCGNPIYGPKEITADSSPDVRRTCICLIIAATQPAHPSITKTAQGGTITAPFGGQIFNATFRMTPVDTRPPDEDGALVA